MASDTETFSNRSGRNGQPFRNVPRLMVTRRERWPHRVDVTPQRPPAPAGAHDAVITFIGHATFLIQSSQGNVLTDPMFSKRASPVPFLGPRRVHVPGVRLEDLPRIDVVLLSHNHYDHLDLRTLRRLGERFEPLVITPSRNGELVRKAGVDKVEELAWWQPSRRAAFPVTCAPAEHFSARTPFDRNRALWGSFVFELAGRRMYFAGDTGYSEHFRMIRARLGRPDVAFLPIGAYEPRWFMKDIHMNPAEAVQAHLDLEARRSIAMHFGTFQLTPEAIDAPVRELRNALETRHVDTEAFRTLTPGASLHVDGATQNDEQRARTQMTR
ncbi:MAG TPA: MBL fold metallo-hydrolase [Gemmatimonadaceae bacterium]|nr:MBL fold metallo-hydrolase [Gemmatimonadaceae bacterium]